jgi:hypothetical protein
VLYSTCYFIEGVNQKALLTSDAQEDILVQATTIPKPNLSTSYDLPVTAPWPIHGLTMSSWGHGRIFQSVHEHGYKSLEPLTLTFYI